MKFLIICLNNFFCQRYTFSKILSNWFFCISTYGTKPKSLSQTTWPWWKFGNKRSWNHCPFSGETLRLQSIPNINRIPCFLDAAKYESIEFLKCGVNASLAEKPNICNCVHPTWYGPIVHANTSVSKRLILKAVWTHVYIVQNNIVLPPSSGAISCAK